MGLGILFDRAATGAVGHPVTLTVPIKRTPASLNKDTVDRSVGQHVGWEADDRTPPIAGTHLILKIGGPHLAIGYRENLDDPVAYEALGINAHEVARKFWDSAFKTGAA